MGAEPLLAAIADLARSLGEIDSLGVGIAGLVTRAGVVRASPNLAIDGELDVAGHLSAELGLRVGVDNDATCATMAEWRFGAGQGRSDVLMVTLGTGIGGGIVAGGRLQRGHNGFAGEIGHMVVDPDGPPCPCGRRGCWERYASGSGLAWLAEGRRGEDVVDDARRGDARSVEVLDRFGWWVALGLANLTNLLDPDVIVLGGGLVDAADVLMPAVRRSLGELLYAPEHRPHPDVVVASLSSRAGALGAAVLGQDA